MTARERLLKKRPRVVEIDGEKFHVRSLSISEGIRVEALHKDPGAALNMILASALLEDDGSQMFTDGDDPAIGEIPFELVPLITEAIQKLSKLKSVTALEKNSEATP